MKRVLLVDSQYSKLQEPLEELLELNYPEVEYTVLGTRDPDEALEILRTKGIDLAILELDLSVCGDYESKQLAQRIKDCLPDIPEEHIGYKLLGYIKKEHPQIRTIILTSYGMCGDRVEDEKANALSKGADSFVLKPCAMMQLVEEVNRALALQYTE
jgi:CheY-like chemotaxis protein